MAGAYDGFDGSLEEKVRQLELENDILRGMVDVLQGFFGRLKNEFFFRRDWKGVAMEEFVSMLSAYLVFCSERRTKEPLGWLSPSDYRRSLGLAA